MLRRKKAEIPHPPFGTTPGDDQSMDALLREYVAMVVELRRYAPGAEMQLRTDDLTELANALGQTPEAIASRLMELTGTTPNEALRVMAMILPSHGSPSQGPEVTTAPESSPH